MTVDGGAAMVPPMWLGVKLMAAKLYAVFGPRKEVHVPILDDTDDVIATDFVSVATGLSLTGAKSPKPQSVVECRELQVQCHPPPAVETIVSCDGGVAYDVRPVEVKLHRRVHKKHKRPYMVALLAQVKVKFGTPARNAANTGAIRKYCAAIMSEHGVRPTDQRQLLPTIIALAYVPDQWEVEADKLMESAPVLERLGAGLWSWPMNRLMPMKWQAGKWPSGIKSVVPKSWKRDGGTAPT